MPLILRPDRMLVIMNVPGLCASTARSASSLRFVSVGAELADYVSCHHILLSGGV